MYGLGTVINVAAIAVGGVLGLLFGRFISERHRDTLGKVCGISVLFIGAAGAIKGMFSVVDGRLVYGGDFLIIGALALGAIVGETINIEDKFEKFGAFLKRKTNSMKDASFIEGFVSASFTVCIGAMAIVGAINDGLYGDVTVLVTKSILDLIIIMVMAASLGKGAIFSALPVGILQGGVTALSLLIRPIMTETALLYLSVVGSILIFCVGINLTFGKKIKVANLLPAIIFAVAFAFLSVCLVIIARRARTSTQKILAISGAIALIAQTVLGILHFFFLIPRHASFVPFVSTGKCYTIACFALLGLVLASLRKDSATTEKVKNRHRIDICVCGAILGAIATVGAMLLMHKELPPETKIARMMPEG